ncbi:ion transporter [Shewanella amazonensis]|uniref:Ion transporter n=1 Tax=Shewanella amazonensis (strain ATCC BAA-1098 / SB2B) TaxID=326297 RepID=A1S917_SHEAM|nr:ion transporter [Shewanella amazonensis]ABM00874.1 ion transporter [Shewanella amazonensis SB2B]
MPEDTKVHVKRIKSPQPIELAMMLLSLLAVIVVLVMTFGRLDAETYRLLFFIDTGICSIFLVHFFIGLFNATNKWHFIRDHWIDFVASIPAIETLRFARLFQILRVIRLVRMSRSLLAQVLRQRRQATLASLLVALVTILTLSSVAILLVESPADGSNILTAEQAIWWAMVTISTVGYGDHYPVTTAGHIVGSMVIVCGVSFFGIISGYMASVFVAPDDEERQEAQAENIRHELDAALKRMEDNQATMLREMAALKHALKEAQGAAKQKEDTDKGNTTEQ